MALSVCLALMNSLILFPRQVSTSALRALPLVSVPTDDGSGRPAHLPQADVRAQHPLPSSRIQTGVPRPAVRTPSYDGGASTPHISRHHDDKAGAEGLHLRLRWEDETLVLCVVVVVLFFYINLLLYVKELRIKISCQSVIISGMGEHTCEQGAAFIEFAHY